MSLNNRRFRSNLLPFLRDLSNEEDTPANAGIDQNCEEIFLQCFPRQRGDSVALFRLFVC